jgi:tetratricopeptide (TPR) repeat protein
VALAVVGVGAGLWVWRAPQMRVSRHESRADRYFQQRQYREATLEYRNVLQIQPDHRRATRQLGLAHYYLGELGHAIRYLPQARATDPDDVEVRIGLGTMYLLGRRPDLARGEAQFVLEREPRSLDALLLWAGAAFTPAEIGEALKRLASFHADFADRAKFHIALGALHLRGKDPAEAERAFRAAVAAEPGSIEAHAILGDFYVSRRDVGQAEQAYRAAAGLAPAASVARLALADFYIGTGKRAEARQVLEEMTRGSADFLPGWRRLAEFEFAEGKHDASLAALDVIFKKSPSDFGAMLLRGRLRLARREVTDAIQDFRKVLGLEPKFAPARYQLAQAYRAQGNVQYARAELRQATQIAPNFAEAVLLLAELDLQAGAPQPAIDALQKLVARQPNDVRTLALLGSAWLAKGDAAKAAETYQRMVALAPNDPRGAFFMGRALRAQGRLAEARRQFELALERAPGLIDPLNHLVAMSFAEKRPDAALERVQRELARTPKSPGLQVVLAAVHLQRGERPQAEAAYRKALELNDKMLVARLALAQLYAESRRYEPALAELERARQAEPKNAATHMLIGLVHERRGDVAAATQAYEQVLALNPRHALAGNNLAYLYSEHGGDKERALQLAQMAKELAPNDPHVSDTLGWILYKRGLYQRARSLLKESAAKLPDNAEVQYHFGMAAWKSGDRTGALAALRAAAGSSRDFPGRDEARKTLSQIQ